MTTTFETLTVLACVASGKDGSLVFASDIYSPDCVRAVVSDYEAALTSVEMNEAPDGTSVVFRLGVRVAEERTRIFGEFLNEALTRSVEARLALKSEIAP
jgi:hypothetical protein